MKFILVTALTLSSINLFALSNPQIRACHQKNGEFLSFTTNNDQIGLCKLGQSYISSLDLVYLAENRTTESIIQYSQKNTTCTGTEIQVAISEIGRSKIFCQFKDGSLMDLETLKLGRDSIQNQELNSALGL